MNRDALGKDLVDAATVEIDNLKPPTQGLKHQTYHRQFSELSGD